MKTNKLLATIKTMPVEAIISGQSPHRTTPQNTAIGIATYSNGATTVASAIGNDDQQTA